MPIVDLKRISALIEELADDGLRNHFSENIPDKTDQIVMGIIEAFTSANDEEKLHLSLLFNIKQSGRLIRYAQRMAIYSIRMNDSNYIFYGLVAVALENFRKDFRDTIWVIPLLKNSAIKLGVDYQSLFLKAATYAGPRVAKFFGDCALEGPDKRTPAEWDFKEGKTKDGQFTYLRSDVMNLPG